MARCDSVKFCLYAVSIPNRIHIGGTNARVTTDHINITLEAGKRGWETAQKLLVIIYKWRSA